jgi:hypothetical protein
MLVRIYGLFTIQTSYFANMDIILMQNIDYTFNPQNPKLFSFDLKGSFVHRKSPYKKGTIMKC